MHCYLFYCFFLHVSHKLSVFNEIFALFSHFLRKISKLKILPRKKKSIFRMSDQDPCKSDLQLTFWKSFNADNFFSMLIEEYQILLATMQHLKNQRQTVLEMRIKHQGCPIYLYYWLSSHGSIFLCYDHLVLCINP